MLFLIAFSVYLHKKEEAGKLPVIYREGAGEVLGASISNDKPFASKNGATYTFSWCSGANNIKGANKIFFKNEESAIASGRRLSKLCTK